MDINMSVNFKTNYSAPDKNSSNKKQIAFNGERGDLYISRIKNGENINPEEIYNEIKNPWYGINKNKFSDVMDSFIGSVKELSEDNEKLSQNIKQRDITAELIDIIAKKTIDTFELLVNSQEQQINLLTEENNYLKSQLNNQNK